MFQHTDVRICNSLILWPQKSNDQILSAPWRLGETKTNKVQVRLLQITPNNQRVNTSLKGDIVTGDQKVRSTPLLCMSRRESQSRVSYLIQPLCKRNKQRASVLCLSVCLSVHKLHCKGRIH